MSAEAFEKLRQPFEGVQHVTKNWQDKKTGDWKSITLDYIGHGPVTDRLLTVDPGYTFEPLLDEGGRPIVVFDGLGAGDSIGVWGRLTILGSTIVEFCSGKDLLDAYSRCLCRCAMRRGVALDLWIKDDEFKASATAPPRDERHPADGPSSPPPAGTGGAALPADLSPAASLPLGFGKHKELSLIELARTDRGYLHWIAETMDARKDSDLVLKADARVLLGGPAEPTPDPDAEDLPF